MSSDPKPTWPTSQVAICMNCDPRGVPLPLNQGRCAVCASESIFIPKLTHFEILETQLKEIRSQFEIALAIIVELAAKNDQLEKQLSSLKDWAGIRVLRPSCWRRMS